MYAKDGKEFESLNRFFYSQNQTAMATPSATTTRSTSKGTHSFQSIGAF
jgi:hypothetical protein